MIEPELPNQITNRLDEEFIKSHISSFRVYKPEFIHKDSKTVLDLVKPAQINNHSSFFKIHSTALYQMSDEQKRILLFCAKKDVKYAHALPKTDQEEKRQMEEKLKPIKRTFKILFNSDVHKKLLYIVKKLDIRQHTTSGTDEQHKDLLMMIVASKPHEIHRVYVLLFNTFNEKDHLIKAATTFALFENFTNIADFCAVGEFAVIKLNEEVDALKDENGTFKPEAETLLIQEAQILEGFDTSKPKEEKLLYILASKLTNEMDKKIEYSQQLSELKKQCITDKEEKFSSKFTEITHFLKHCVHDKNFKTSTTIKKVEDYTKYLRTIMQEKNASKSLWTQEGTHKFNDYKFEFNRYVYTLHILQDVLTNERTIVTILKGKRIFKKSRQTKLCFI